MKHYEYLAIGGGSGGIASVNRAARLGRKCALVEARDIGGTCVNVGCVPKKITWQAAGIAEAIQRYAPDHGFDLALRRFDLRRLAKSRSDYIDRIHGHYRDTLANNRVEYVEGVARFVDARTVEVNGEQMTADHILVATGTHPARPAIPGAELGIDSDGFFELQELPRRTAVVGAGYVAVELSGVLNALGSDTHLFVRRDGPLRSFDPLLAGTLVEIMSREGPTLHTQAVPESVSRNPDGSLTLQLGNGKQHVTDCVLWAIGRVPDTSALDPAAAGIELDARGYIATNAFQDTNVPGIHAVGDITGRAALTPVAVAAGRRLAERLFNDKPDERLDYENIPTVVFSHPPIGTIGLPESRARERYGDANVTVYQSSFTPMYSGATRHRQPARFKLVCTGPEQRIVGLHGIGHGVDEALQGFAVAIRMGATKRDFDDTVAIHPTAAEEFVTMGS